MNKPMPENEEQIKEMLTPEEYAILREKGTEAPFSSEFVHEKADGTYGCKVCGNPLFDSSAKFDSGTGWPSFDKPIEGSVITHNDSSHGMNRTEITCAKCGSHLGHVFDDGPTETGQRYCINGLCLDLEEK
jgi:peptide-methionine (R)-S-oxide reductase